MTSYSNILQDFTTVFSVAYFSESFLGFPGYQKVIWFEVAMLVLQSTFLWFPQCSKTRWCCLECPGSVLLPRKGRFFWPSLPRICFVLIQLGLGSSLSTWDSVFSQAWKGAMALPTASSHLQESYRALPNYMLMLIPATDSDEGVYTTKPVNATNQVVKV